MFLDLNTKAGQYNKFKSFRQVAHHPAGATGKRIIVAMLVILLLVLCLPWTQNIQSAGFVSTLNPQQRPQQINSIIAGRISRWLISDGDFVTKGDTLVLINEIKDDYLDPSQLRRINEQIKAKQNSIDFYRGKASAATAQSEAQKQALSLKLNQLTIKLKQYNLLVQSDSISFVAATNQLAIAKQQQQRQKELYDEGLKSLTEFEQRQQAYQDAQAKKLAAENKFYNSRNELITIELDQSAIRQEYAEKIAKASGERFAALSELAASQSEVAKLRNQFSNYSLRRDFYVIVAPQSGQVLRTSKAGIGETVKEGDPLLEIVPVNFKAAVELFIDPVDLPLVSRGQQVQLQFDGFPAIVFSGWPNSSYGTFNGKIAAIDASIGLNGKFKAWVVPVEQKKAWPQQLKYGAGAKGIALLKDVPLVYELWRRLNGFPPEYYVAAGRKADAKKQ